MNSDKLDKYFKEQIDSLNTVSVPGSNWKPEKSWEKINQQDTGRRKVVFWWSLSSVAAVVLIFLMFWFSNIGPAVKINSTAGQDMDISKVKDTGESNKNLI